MKYTFTFLIVLLLSSCHIGRFVTKNFANISDHKIFPYTEISSLSDKAAFPTSPNAKVEAMKFTTKNGEVELKAYLQRETKTTAFLVVHKGEIKFEEYFRGYEKSDISNIFSVSKSITSLLVGIAVDEGLIEDINDPITKYLPEFKEDAPKFKRLTIDNLLQMRSGLKYKESYSSPFADMAKLYYGLDQVGQLRSLKFESEPGTDHNYQSASTALLGMVVERVSNMELGDYLEQKVWKPMGMRHDATWSVDDKKNRSTKAYCCLNTTAHDLAMIAQLYLNSGLWKGQQIVSADWVQASIKGDLENDCYQKQWYNLGGRASGADGTYTFNTKEDGLLKAADLELENYEVKYDSEARNFYIDVCLPDFYAKGILGQFIYVNPKTQTIVIRLGEKYDISYIPIMRRIAKLLDEED
jgi:CubicO group peptidase (beta-lactamase class C family)